MSKVITKLPVDEKCLTTQVLGANCRNEVFILIDEARQ